MESLKSNLIPSSQPSDSQSMLKDIDRRFCIAPMMDYSDRHSRYFLRLFSSNILLYTEMITAAAIVHGDAEKLLGFNSEEHPVAVQLGGSDPEQLHRASKICQGFGYDEVNLNCGCPSDRVKSGSFGACLMDDPGLVAESVAAMKSAALLPVTVKHRTGLDQQNDYDRLAQFASAQLEAGAAALIVHARNAWLQGLSPKQNREVPPLKYDWVYRLKEDFPQDQIVINGGIKTLESCCAHLQQVDGVMLGREPYQNPFMLAEVDQVVFGQSSNIAPDRITILQQYYAYVERQLSQGTRLTHLIRPVMGLFHQQPNARRWRRQISENAYLKTAGIEVLHQAERLLAE